MSSDYIPPGALVGVSVNGVIHQGIMSDGFVDGERAVISRSSRSGQALEESWTTFTGGRKGFLMAPLSDLDPLEVLHNAKALVRYSMGSFFSKLRALRKQGLFGMKPTSPQLKRGLAALAIGLAIAAVLLRRK